MSPTNRSTRNRRGIVRVALGARPFDLMRLVLGQGLALAIAGTFAGLLGALSVTRVLQHLLFQVDPADPITLGTVAALLMAASLAACWLPARRAARGDPLVALRHE